jgi:hypothetical protein
MEEKKKKKDELIYEPPEMIKYSNDDILEEVGPAQACSASPYCPVSG